MALVPTKLLRPAASAETTAPLAGTRSQSVQRLQVGLFGLAAMLLLVGLAGIINDNKEQNEAGIVPEAVATGGPAEETTVTSDPLADAGVVPDMPSAAAPVAGENADAQPPVGP